MDMDKGSSASRSLWMSTPMPTWPPLGTGLHTDVCIVGAGIAGLTTAYCLLRERRRVVVLDDGPPGGGMTERTTAHLSNMPEKGFVELERLHGRSGARRAVESHRAAIDRIEAICRQEQIACDFLRLHGYLFAGKGQGLEVLDEEREAARRAGLMAVERLPQAPKAAASLGPCLRIPNQAQFHPMKYLAGLVEAVRRDGGRLVKGHVTRVTDGVQPQIETREGCFVTADAVVVATNTPINNLVSIHTKQAPYTSYVVGARIPAEAVEAALYWDTLDPYHYVRLHRSSNDGAPLLIVGGEDHKTGQADDSEQRYARLEAWGREHFPMMGTVEYRWSGQVMESIDGLGFIGRNPSDSGSVYIATGDCGMGMTHGTIAGMLITDLVVGRPSPWASLYNPARRTAVAVGEYVQESLNMAAQYADWVTGGDVPHEKEIPPESGAVLRRGLSKLAVYRDAQGALHRCSAVCPHLSCIVAWNHSEKTWDCPCHGSHFDRFGTVINGPAHENLEPVKEE
ncbi:MAG: Cytochrome b6-f complex iron-sulfur subunit [Nitrospirae bacterium]|nr:Cytochrome b6-f complex iron-sulfur subunit [Nitrospirota bacterium]